MLGIKDFFAVYSIYLIYFLHSLKLSDVLDLLDLKEPHSDVYITVIPKDEKNAIESDCDNDCTDREYQGETGHLPARLPNGEAEVTRKILTH